MEKKMRSLESFPYKGKGNSLNAWQSRKSPLRVVFNFMIIQSCKYIPFLGMKSWLLRRTGMNVGKNVSIGLSAMFDIFFPELIEIGDNTIIGYGSTILCHEFLVREFRKGNVKIGSDCMIGALSLVMPGVSVGSNATVAAYSLVNRDVPDNGFVGGVPARPIGGRNESG